MNQISNFLTRIDLFGIQMPFYYKKRTLYKTKLGGVFTIFSISLITALAIAYVMNLITKKSFNVITSDYYNPKEEIDFSKSPFLFTISNDQGQIIELDQNSYTLDVMKLTTQKANTEEEKAFQTIQERIEFDKCDKIENENVRMMFKDYNLSKYFCLNPNQNLNISGNFGDFVNGNKEIRFYISKRKENRSGSEPDTIPSLNFNLYYIQGRYDHYLTGDDIVFKEIQTKKLVLSTNFLKTFYLIFSKGYYTIDDNLFFHNRKAISFYRYKSVRTDVEELDYSSKEKVTFACVAIQSTSELDVLSKEYVKLGTALGNLGGLIQLIIQVFNVINIFFSRNIFTLDLINNVVLKEEKESYYVKKLVFSENAVNNSQSIQNTVTNSLSFQSLNLNNRRLKNISIVKWYNYIFPLSLNFPKGNFASLNYLSEFLMRFLGIESIYKSNYHINKNFNYENLSHSRTQTLKKISLCHFSSQVLMNTQHKL